MTSLPVEAPFLPIDYTPWNLASVYWLAWLVVGFLVPELTWIALGQYQNTLSAQVWRVANTVAGQPISQWGWPHWTVAVALLLLFSWLIVHFDFGWLR